MINGENNSLGEIVKSLDNLETRFNQLYEQLKKGELPIDEKLTRVVTISEAVRIETMTPLNMGKKDLIKYYNECAELLKEYAVEVQLIPELYRQFINGGNTGIKDLIFERSSQGSYWVIVTEIPRGDQLEKLYWLLPNGKSKSFKYFQNNIIEKLFEIQASTYSGDEISLIEPAQVVICPNGNQWKLPPDKKGVITRQALTVNSYTGFELAKISALQEQLEAKINEFEQYKNSIAQLSHFTNALHNFHDRLDKLTQIEAEIMKINQIVESFSSSLQAKEENQFHLSQLQQTLTNSQGKLQSLEAQLSNLNQRINNLTIALEQKNVSAGNNTSLDQINVVLSNQVQTVVQQQRQLQKEIDLLKQKIKSPLELFIEQYNQNPQTVKNQVLIISETQESIKQRFIGNSHNLTFEINKDGVYWLWQLEQCFYLFLFDPHSLEITEVAIEKTLKLLFECRNYQAGKRQNPPMLIKPAQLILINQNPRQWQLKELGILEFSYS